VATPEGRRHGLGVTDNTNRVSMVSSTTATPALGPSTIKMLAQTAPAPNTTNQPEEADTLVKNFRFLAVAACGSAAVMFGPAAPAQAAPAADAPIAFASMTNISNGIAHHTWIDYTRPHVTVPKVDTSVHQSR